MTKLILPNPRTLIRTGVIPGTLAEIIGRFDLRCVPLKHGLGNTEKYALFNDQGNNYLFIVSRQKNGEKTPLGYNSIVTITSRFDEINLETLARLEKAASVKYDLQVPGFLRDGAFVWNSTYLVFEEQGQAAMEILRDVG